MLVEITVKSPERAEDILYNKKKAKSTRGGGVRRTLNEKGLYGPPFPSSIRDAFIVRQLLMSSYLFHL